jgi:hypothetical protein
VVRYDYAFVVPEEMDPLGYFEPSVGVRDGIVVGISLNSRWVSNSFDYSLAGLLESFGPPDEVWLKLNVDSAYEPTYELNLFYPTRGILLNATGTAQDRGGYLAVCPKEFNRGLFPPALVLWSPTDQITHGNFRSALLGREDIDRGSFALLDELTDNFNHNDFYRTYLDPQTTACFDVTLARQP